MGKNQKDKKEGKQENKAAAPSQERKLQEKEIAYLKTGADDFGRK